ncbi:MAG: sensor histidine kinase [Gammaproteobacteria bacterium]
MNALRGSCLHHWLFVMPLLVALPLAAALVDATLAVDRLGQASRGTVLEAVRMSQAAQRLSENLSALERNARQYQLIPDQQLRVIYESRRAELQRAALDLEAGADAGLREALRRLLDDEARLHASVARAVSVRGAASVPGARFEVLAALSRPVYGRTAVAVERRAQALRDTAGTVQRRLVRQALAVIPAALGAALLASWVIGRPLRRVDRAIRNLGLGQLDAPVQVRGPRDIEAIGIALEWLRARMVQARAQQERALQHVSHELKAPLASVREGAQLLNDGAAGPLSHAQLEIVRILCAGSQRLQQRVAAICAFDRCVHSVPEEGMRELRLDRIVDDVLSAQAMSVRTRGLATCCDLAPARVRGDPEAIRIAVENLVSNAVKYSPSGGTIRLATREIGRCAEFELCDEGPGIAPAERDRIFEPYFRGSAALQLAVEGWGLGLAIVEEYVRSHHGTIEVLPGGPGAHLRMRLPRSARPWP